METIAQSLSGTDRPLVAAFGTLAMKPGRLATEDKAYDPESVGATRAKAEDTMRELAARGIRTSVIRLPPIVHGAGRPIRLCSPAHSDCAEEKGVGVCG